MVKIEVKYTFYFEEEFINQGYNEYIEDTIDWNKTSPPEKREVIAPFKDFVREQFEDMPFEDIEFLCCCNAKEVENIDFNAKEPF